MIADPWFWALALPAVALTGISKGALGGGAAIAVPLMALAIPPAQAAAVMLPALCLMDLAGIRAYLGKWDARIMRIIVPAGLAGCVIGALTFRHLSEHWIRILLGSIALGFLAWSYYPKKRLARTPPPAAGWFWGTLSGFTSFPVARPVRRARARHRGGARAAGHRRHLRRPVAAAAHRCALVLPRRPRAAPGGRCETAL
ncbi:MAG TPA: sulfite exporter TauE/SafE family protein [Burkholderiales bacterium]|nr:sulfite exporter TauE/SafE family protein [Burkholderiales bacterium]